MRNDEQGPNIGEAILSIELLQFGKNKTEKHSVLRINQGASQFYLCQRNDMIKTI